MLVQVHRSQVKFPPFNIPTPWFCQNPTFLWPKSHHMLPRLGTHKSVRRGGILTIVGWDFGKTKGWDYGKVGFWPDTVVHHAQHMLTVTRKSYLFQAGPVIIILDVDCTVFRDGSEQPDLCITCSINSTGVHDNRYSSCPYPFQSQLI